MNKLQKTMAAMLGLTPLLQTLDKQRVYADNSSNPVPCGMDDNYLFDFKNYGADRGYAIPIESSGPAPEKPLKLKIKPVDVLSELEKTPTNFSLFNLDDKISVLRDKAKLVRQHYAKLELEGLIERIENRKKYEEHKEFFNQFDNTTEEKIDKILSKYELVMKGADIFIPDFPDVGIKLMTDYIEVMIQICGKKPVFYVIAEESCFKKVYEKRDPILLVQSPFGFYWQILAAWDKEMLLLSEL
jgi:hypothetical protein